MGTVVKSRKRKGSDNRVPQSEENSSEFDDNKSEIAQERETTK
jgi:hypothetical protein